MSDVCLGTEALLQAVEVVPHILRENTLIVFFADRFDIWAWVSNRGGWCRVVFNA